MAILKCKMCGGDVEIAADKTFGTCEYCGCSMTFPKIDDDQKAAMFNRGNHFRRIGEFDKALAVYEHILNEDNANAEAHWCCALSRFGIEYVEDPATMEWLPTCHRASFDSFLEDVDYLAAVEYSDGITKRQYQRDALKISEVQKGILATSQNSEPYDIFICYKESDEHGQRTRDSLLAQEIYYQLIEQGRRVFFSRITLEDVVGTQYEPYIFAALNSAKVMIVVGTKPEYLNAVWVKNEWSRFISMMKKERTKLLLPCYRDMDPYDMPEALSVLQSYDMSKIGFIQDLTRGISKVLDSDKPKEVKVTETVNVQSTLNPNLQSLMKRAFIFLEDKEWDKADEYLEKILDIDPENGEAYLGKMLVELGVSTKSELINLNAPFDDCDNYSKVIRYADSKLKNELEGYLRFIDKRNENERLLSVYADAKSLMAEGTAESYRSAEELFKNILDYKDSRNLTEKCRVLRNEVESSKQKTLKLQEELRQTRNLSKKISKTTRDVKLLKNQKESIDGISDKLEDYLEKMKGIKDLVAKNDEEISALINKKDSLGLFAVKQKNEIHQKVKKLTLDNRELMNEYSSLDKMCQGFSSLDELKNKLRDVEESLNKSVSRLTALQIVRSKDEIIADLEQTKEGKLIVDRFHALERLSQSCKLGNTVSFGFYNNEKIEWKVLSVSEDKALLITKEAIDCKRYNEKGEDVTWEVCTLRKWLNNEFISQTFDEDEKEKILTTKVEPHKNPGYDTKQGNATQDKAFLLSIQEAKQYFKNDDERCCKPSNTARSKRVYLGDNGNCWWWLRSAGNIQSRAAIVRSNGSVGEIGCDVYSGSGGVCPALWINLNS